jgi:RNA polymerase sigma factor (TIGR02999 family)
MSPAPASDDPMLPEVYAQLKAIARKHLSGERANHTLSPTALVHEAWLKMQGGAAPVIKVKERQHFLALVGKAMRQILVNYALAKKADKRAGGERVTLSGIDAHSEASSPFDVLALDSALTQLQQHDPRAAMLAELRAFAGLSLEEAAEALEISPATAKRDWLYAKLWLARELGDKS